jgi:quercetin dioxygenase-like cupin family protein
LSGEAPGETERSVDVDAISIPRPVVHLDRDAARAHGPGAAVQSQLPPVAESPLSLEAVFLDPGAGFEVSGEERDAIVYVSSGSVDARIGAEAAALERGGAAHLTTGRRGRLVAGAEGAQLFVFAVDRTADEHAPLGEPRAFNRVDFSDLDPATSNRSFQVLFGPGNGSLHATFFVGIVPPGAAPWHFHQYDEIVVLSEGEMTFHQPGHSVVGQAGTAFRILPRDLHVNENTSATEDAIELGIFTPAGSPSAAYLPPS